MSESELHLSMVKKLRSNLLEEFGRDSIIVFCDDGLLHSEPPPMINGTRPDLYANDPIRDFHVIGEAKTWPDLQTKHSKDQIWEQINFLSTKTEYLYLLMVPYGYVGAGRSIVRECTMRLACESLPSRIIEFRPD